MSGIEYDKAILLSASSDTDDEEQVEGTQLVPSPLSGHMIDVPRDGLIEVSDRNGAKEAAGYVGGDARAPHLLGDNHADGKGGGYVGVDARAPRLLGIIVLVDKVVDEVVDIVACHCRLASGYCDSSQKLAEEQSSTL